MSCRTEARVERNESRVGDTVDPKSMTTIPILPLRMAHGENCVTTLGWCWVTFGEESRVISREWFREGDIGGRAGIRRNFSNECTDLTLVLMLRLECPCHKILFSFWNVQLRRLTSP